MNLSSVPGYDLKVVVSVIKFFTSKYTDTKTFEKIKTVCKDGARRKIRPNPHTLQHGYLSISDYCHYVTTTGESTGVPMRLVHETLKKLEEANILIDGTTLLSIDAPIDAEYTCTKYGMLMYTHDLIVNVIHDWNFIINRYCNSVFMIENMDGNGETSLGTGFFTRIDGVPIIVTNAHVFDKSTKIKVKNKNEITVEHTYIYKDDNADLGIIILKNDPSVLQFYISTEAAILSEIITIGYPTIPMTQKPYQLYHKGEVNSFVKDYNNNDLFLFSAKSSSGNSGSPVIDRFGLVAGIVTQELFEKDAFVTKGKLPYYAAIPPTRIMRS